MAATQLHLAVALDGTGWHPASWREPAARPDELFSPAYWTDLVRTAERGLLDFVAFEDTFGIQSAPLGRDDAARTDQVQGRGDALLTASFVAPLTSRIGLIPAITVTHTEPFHIAKATATLDHTSLGRAGWQPRVSVRPADAALVGRRTIPGITRADLAGERLPPAFADLFAEAGDVIEVVRRLWDSWEDGAEIRDVATRRFVDRERVHRVDFEGRFFSVRGPSITPRSPQGQPVVAVLAHRVEPWELAAAGADLVYLTPGGPGSLDAEGVLANLRRAVETVGGRTEPLRVFADLVVVLDSPDEPASARLRRLDEAAGEPLVSDAAVFAGSVAELADLLTDWQALGYHGVRLRPAVLPDDLDHIAADLVPELQRRGLFRTAYPPADGTGLRGLLGLPVDVPNRYATAPA
ncbi:MAG TPA: LLM class flavin-dependent oxidoreductase [Pseudonocardia sp.]|jgi:alkanesulfonate monooxygenase SsuD/methylene tetrahydromethanopterin reductase-like flavin-dependent oxidoreductase (luciferase family)|nr:LLM class flavin-dependent oxidoreductase [Pseudonocardia sp.]